jgi:hypothetical protein
MEDDLKILKVGHLSNHLLDPTKILNLSLDYKQNYLQILEMKWKPIKISKGEISTTTVRIVTYEFLGGIQKKTQRKSRVWLCSAQLVFPLLLFPNPNIKK